MATPVGLSGLIVAGLAFGVPAAAAVARAEGHRLTDSAAAAKAAFQPSGHSAPDPSIVVIDEVAGMWISIFLLPFSVTSWTLAFLLFRGMDILKPEPARYVERFQDGWGIMLDARTSTPVASTEPPWPPTPEHVSIACRSVERDARSTDSRFILILAEVAVMG